MAARADYVNTTAGPGDAELGTRRSADSSDPAVIAHDIEQTREEMTGTIGAIQERLEPERLSAEAKEVAQFASAEARDVAHHVIEEAKAAVRELADQATTAVHDATIGRINRATETTRHGAEGVTSEMLSTIKANPIPAALAAVGIGWMMMHRGNESGQRSGSGSGAGSGYGGSGWNAQATGYGSHPYDAYGVNANQGQSTSQQAQQMAGQMGHQVQERASQMQHQVGDAAGQMQHRIGDTAGQVQQQAQGFWQTLQSNPIAAAALGLGLGAIAGVAIPESQRENQLMGETRDSVIGSVKEIAGEKIGQVQQIAKEAGELAMEEAKAQGVVPGGSGSGSGSSSSSSSASSMGSGASASASPS